MHNPYIEQHIANEAIFTGNADEARRIVEMEYSFGGEPVDCECGGKAHYKATIGVMKCVDCGELYHSNGMPV